MPPFTRKKPASEITTPASATEPEPSQLSAAERLTALLAEQAEIHATLDQHREKRTELLRAEGELDLDAVRAVQEADAGLRLRLEQLALRLPAVEQELDEERREAFEAAWQDVRPSLAAAEAELTEAIRGFFSALAQSNTLYGRAQGFGLRLREFVRPPPTIIFNEWALREYLKAIDRRQGTEPAPSQMVELSA